MTTRVHMGRLDAITGGKDQFGLYVAGPDGTTIIDGTSNMLKIAAVGTLATSSFSNPANPGASASVDLEILPAERLAHMIFLETGSTAKNVPHLNIDNAGTVLDWYIGRVEIVAGKLQVYVQVSSSRGSGTTNGANWRYYVFQEAAI